MGKATGFLLAAVMICAAAVAFIALATSTGGAIALLSGNSHGQVPSKSSRLMGASQAAVKTGMAEMKASVQKTVLADQNHKAVVKTTVAGMTHSVGVKATEHSHHPEASKAARAKAGKVVVRSIVSAKVSQHERNEGASNTAVKAGTAHVRSVSNRQMPEHGDAHRVSKAAAKMSSVQMNTAVHLEASDTHDKHATMSTTLKASGRKGKGFSPRRILETHDDKERRLRAIFSRAEKLQKQAQHWMVQGEFTGETPRKSMSLCGGITGKDTEEQTDGMYGCGGMIPGDVARDWRKQYEAKGGVTVPENSFFDASSSDVWGNSAHKGWDSAEGVKEHGSGGDWLSPARWIAERRMSGRELPEDGATLSGSVWPHTIGTRRPPATPLSQWGDRGQLDWRQFLRGVSRRYDEPTGSEYMEAMYDKLRAGNTGGLADLDDAIRGLDKEASLAGKTVERAYSAPMPEVSS